MAEFDYGLKVHARRLDQWLGQLAAMPLPSNAPDPGARNPGGVEAAAQPKGSPSV
jgi:hypothetical protein